MLCCAVLGVMTGCNFATWAVLLVLSEEQDGHPVSNTVQVPDTSSGGLQGSRDIFLIMQGPAPGQRTMTLF